jgi:predicted DNA-binding transcriptional regulator YafY
MTDEAEILFALIRLRYAARLDAEQLAELHKTVEALVRDVAALRAATIPDDAEPGQPFIPFRAEP